VLPLENSNLYKVDVSVGIKGTFSIKTDSNATSKVIVNFVQRHFVVDKEGLTFQSAAEEALADCFRLVHVVFTGTKDKKIYVLNNDEKEKGV
jgi:hypothetical protein